MDLNEWLQSVRSGAQCGALPYSVCANSVIRVSKNSKQLKQWKLSIYLFVATVIFEFLRSLHFYFEATSSPIFDSSNVLNLGLCLAWGLMGSTALLLEVMVILKLEEIPVLINSFVAYVKLFSRKK